MMNITTKENGFIFNGIDYEFKENELPEIINENQVHILTKQGVLLFDLSCTIDGLEFSDINLFANRIKQV